MYDNQVFIIKYCANVMVVFTAEWVCFLFYTITLLVFIYQDFNVMFETVSSGTCLL